MTDVTFETIMRLTKAAGDRNTAAHVKTVFPGCKNETSAKWSTALEEVSSMTVPDVAKKHFKMPCKVTDTASFVRMFKEAVKDAENAASALPSAATASAWSPAPAPTASAWSPAATASAQPLQPVAAAQPLQPAASVAEAVHQVRHPRPPLNLNEMVAQRRDDKTVWGDLTNEFKFIPRNEHGEEIHEEVTEDESQHTPAEKFDARAEELKYLRRQLHEEVAQKKRFQSLAQGFEVELADVRSSIVAKERVWRQERQEFDARAEELKYLHQQLDVSIRQVGEQANKISSLENRDAEVLALQAERVKFEQRQQELSETIERLEHEKSQLKQQLENAERMVQEQANKITSLENRDAEVLALQAERVKCEQQEAKISALENEHAVHESEYATCRALYVIINTRYETLQGEHDALTETLKLISVEKTKFERMVHESIETSERLAEQNTTMKAEITQLKEQHEAVCRVTDETQQFILAEKEAQLATIREQNAELSQAREKLQAEHESLKGEFEILEAQRRADATLVEKVDQLETQVGQLSDENQRLKLRKQAYDAALAQSSKAQATCNSLKAQLTEVQFRVKALEEENETSHLELVRVGDELTARMQEDLKKTFSELTIELLESKTVVQYNDQTPLLPQLKKYEEDITRMANEAERLLASLKTEVEASEKWEKSYLMTTDELTSLEAEHAKLREEYDQLITKYWAEFTERSRAVLHNANVDKIQRELGATLSQLEIVAREGETDPSNEDVGVLDDDEVTARYLSRFDEVLVV